MVIGRIIEVADDRRHLFVSRGFMVIQDTERERQELGRVPIDDIAAIIANAHGLTYSNNLLVSLVKQGAPFVLCGSNHNAVGMLLPVEGNFQQAKRFDAQLVASKPTQKRLWADIVRAKIIQQASVLEAAGAPPTPLTSLVGKIRSGDPGNIEAQAARRYWGLLFGESFRRDQGGAGLNSLLNYGYTVYRAAMARAIVAAGLHPTLGIHHSNESNAMRLVDDLMEPFRPTVDFLVWQMQKRQEYEVTPNTKRVLVHSLYEDRQTDVGATPTMVCMQRLAVSVVQVYLGERETLDLPLPGLSLALAIDGD